jgi:hypothetical protein
MVADDEGGAAGGGEVVSEGGAVVAFDGFGEERHSLPRPRPPHGRGSTHG